MRDLLLTDSVSQVVSEYTKKNLIALMRIDLHGAELTPLSPPSLWSCRPVLPSDGWEVREQGMALDLGDHQRPQYHRGLARFQQPLPVEFFVVTEGTRGR